MKKHLHLIIIFISLIILNSCSNDDDDSQSCPQTEIASMEINDESKQFDINGWGIDLDNDGTGHTLSLWLMTGVLQPQQDTYAITIKLPYKQTGNNIIEEINYFRVQNGTSSEIDFGRNVARVGCTMCSRGNDSWRKVHFSKRRTCRGCHF